MLATKFGLWGATGLLIAVLATLSFGQAQLPRAEVAKIAKPATALVLLKAGTGSAFCIHTSGYFVTNEHVVRNASEGGTITLVLDSSLETQKTFKARIVRFDKELDLALLKVDGDHKFAALTLGSDEGLTELTELIAFGFPFGKALAKETDYPAITVNVVNVSAMRKDANQELHRIQLDSNLNQGNSGGPVVDLTGKVVGVVVSGIARAGINNAIPVRHLRRFLERPEIVFLPPTLHVNNKHEPAEFLAMATALPLDATALDLELVIENPGGLERRFPMKSSAGKYSAKAVPVPAPKADDGVRLEIKYADATVNAVTADRKFRVGKDMVQLSEVRILRPGPKTQVVLSNGKTFQGPLADLDSLSVKVGGQSLELKLTGVVDLHVIPLPPQDRLAFTIIAKKAGQIVGRLEKVMKFEGAPRVAAGNAAEDAKKLEGLWLLEVGESGGKFYGPRQGDEAIYIEKKEILWTNKQGTERGGQTAMMMIDSASDPKTFDFIITRGKHNGQKVLGIYKFEGDKLVIATSEHEAENRPTRFSTELSAGVGRAAFVRTYVRVTE